MCVKSFRPFNGYDTTCFEKIVKPDLRKIVAAGETVQIDMIQGQTPRILVDQGVGRAGDINVIRYAEAPGQP